MCSGPEFFFQPVKIDCALRLGTIPFRDRQAELPRGAPCVGDKIIGLACLYIELQLRLRRAATDIIIAGDFTLRGLARAAAGVEDCIVVRARSADTHPSIVLGLVEVNRLPAAAPTWVWAGIAQSWVE